jgi:hypothetical protein
MDVSGQLHAVVTLPARKDAYLSTPLVPVEYKTGYAPEPIWSLWIRENSLSPAVDGTTISRLPIR